MFMREVKRLLMATEVDRKSREEVVEGKQTQACLELECS